MHRYTDALFVNVRELARHPTMLYLVFIIGLKLIPNIHGERQLGTQLLRTTLLCQDVF